MYDLKPYRKNSSVSTYNPFRDIEELERRFFGEPFGGFFRGSDLAEFRTDISDQGDSYLLEADLPGFEKKDIQLSLSDNTLTVEAERHSESEDEDKKSKYLRIERSYGHYSRQFDVSAIDTEKITAKYENGVLKLTLPKKQETLPESRKLEIE